jgi:amino acid adenylation domain-containing protein
VDTELAESAATRELTAAVSRIWCDVLGADTVDPQASLFELGGHSLLAARIIARMRAELRTEVPFGDFFEDPTVAGTAALVARCRAAHVPAAGRGDGPAAGPGAETAALAAPPDPARSAALCSAQERLWFLHQLNPADVSYHLPVTLRIHGTLDVELLARALTELTGRHDMLRSTFAERDGRPVQTIGARGPGLERIDLSGRPDPEHARALLAERADRPFDLEHGPVLRLTLIRLGADDHLLGLVLHHIAGDGWSLEVLLAELSELYAAYAAGEPSPLPPLELGYLDHVRQAEGRDDAAALAYWTEQLAGAPALDLPTDHPRPPVRSGRGERLTFALPSDLLGRLEALARAERGTMFMVLLAAFQTLLARYSGQRDVCVGTPVLGRDDPRAERVIGYFAATVVLRGDLGGDPTFRDFLRATRRTALRGIMRQNVGLERIVAALRTERDRSRTPLFQAMFMLMRQPDLKPRLGELDAEIFDQGLSGAKTDFGIDVYLSPGGANGVCSYDADLFDRTTIERMIASFRVLLEDIAARPDARISELARPDPNERARLLAQGNDTAADRPRTDRLPPPAAASAARAGGGEPRTPAQHRVAQVFAEVLGCGPVGVDDDFFALGGDSLLAAKTVARLDGLPFAELFAHPTVGDLAAVLERHAVEQAAAAPRRAGGAAQLSPAQQRLWFLHRLEPESAAYNLFNVWRLRGPLAPDALRAAIGDLAARHEILRTRYPDDDGRPAVTVEPAGSLGLEEVEARGAEDDAERLVAARVNAPFDLTAAPPVRVCLIRLAEDDHILCLVLHHIAGDGWSLNVLRADLAALYAARRHGAVAALAEPRVQYADIGPEYWNRDRDAALAYWRAKLAEPTVLDLPTDRPRPRRSAQRGDMHSFRLPEEAARGLEAVGRQYGATLFMVLLTAYQVLLSRHSGQDDILVGTPVAGRDRVEFEPVVGYFTRTVVLRAEVAADLPFDQLLVRTRRAVLDALDHQDVPFEDLLAALGVERDPARTPLFQTMAILHSQDEDAAGDTFADLGFAFFDAGFRQAKFDLMLEAWRDEDGLSLLLDYDAELFDGSTVATLAQRFVVLLGAIVADPSRPVADLPMLTAADRRFLDAHAHAAADHGPLVPELIARAAARAPDAVAVSCGDETLSYAQLRDRADAVASRLAGHDVVGVCLERSADMVVALLAAWSAGAAYLPLDPEYPAERREFMIADSGASAVITAAVVTDASASANPAITDRAVAEPVVEHAPACVIYTSGSTGVPKGVAVTHANLAARVRWMVDAYELGPDDRVVQFASLSFDAHAEEIFPALAAGARVVLLPDGGASLPDFLAVSPDVTVLDLPTAYWHQLVELIDEVAWPDALRLVILGGQQASGAAVDRWRQRFGGRVRLVNTYGPTEATIIATAADLAGGDVRPPIGRSIGATGVQVLDRAGRLVPPGVVGELAIGGAGVAAGYLARPALTAARFVPDPKGEPGARRYLTGDLVRWRGDGDLEFLARLDDQLKVRGFRVEPGEVETAILGHHAIGEAAVIARDDALVAYVVGSASGDELRRHLAQALPAHLVPDVVVHVDRLPLTAAGKIDRAALAGIAPAPAPAEAGQASADEGPLSDAEQLVAETWAELLGLERVRAADHFFRLGGHSLIALRMIARVRAATQVNVPVRTLFTHPVLRDFAAAVEELLVAELDALTDEEAQRLLATTEDS